MKRLCCHGDSCLPLWNFEFVRVFVHVFGGMTLLLLWLTWKPITASMFSVKLLFVNWTTGWGLLRVSLRMRYHAISRDIDTLSRIVFLFNWLKSHLTQNTWKNTMCLSWLWNQDIDVQSSHHPSVHPQPLILRIGYIVGPSCKCVSTHVHVQNSPELGQAEPFTVALSACFSESMRRCCTALGQL